MEYETPRNFLSVTGITAAGIGIISKRKIICAAVYGSENPAVRFFRYRTGGYEIHKFKIEALLKQPLFRRFF